MRVALLALLVGCAGSHSPPPVAAPSVAPPPVAVAPPRARRRGREVGRRAFRDVRAPRLPDARARAPAARGGLVRRRRVPHRVGPHEVRDARPTRSSRRGRPRVSGAPRAVLPRRARGALRFGACRARVSADDAARAARDVHVGRRRRASVRPDAHARHRLPERLSALHDEKKGAAYAKELDAWLAAHPSFAVGPELAALRATLAALTHGALRTTDRRATTR